MIKIDGDTLIIKMDGKPEEDIADNFIGFAAIAKAVMESFPEHMREDVKLLLEFILDAEEPITEAESIAEFYRKNVLDTPL